MTTTILSRANIYPPAGHIGNNFTFALPALTSPISTTYLIRNMGNGLVYFNLGSASVLPTGPTVMCCPRLESGEETLTSYPDWASGTPPRIGITMHGFGGYVYVANVTIT
jgi:hypothetical protein